MGNCHGCGCIKKTLFDRQVCREGWEKWGVRCYPKCGSGMSPVGCCLCSAECLPGQTDTGAFCVDNNCPPNAKCLAGVIWYDCEEGWEDVGALCRKKCDPKTENDVLGVCWARCPPGTVDVGALCRENCAGDTPNDIAGVCWGDCGSDIDVGALCRQRCRKGFHEVAGVCWGDTGTYARQTMIPKSHKTYDPGYNPPKSLAEAAKKWTYCNFSSPVMLDRMAQFYYDQSTLNPTIKDDGRVSYEYIVMFYGVIASSELSCDVACKMKTVSFDPITGENYEESFGTSYPEDPGNAVSYRRFYFIRITAEDVTKNPTLVADVDGQFTVTGCTHADYTAPDAQVKSTDEGVDPVPSLPKVFDVKNRPQPTFDNTIFAASFVSTAANVGLGVAGGQSTKGQIIGGVAGGMAGEALNNVIRKARDSAVSEGVDVQNVVVMDDKGNYNIVSNNVNFRVNHGPIYELRAANNNGYIPEITFCGNKNAAGKVTSKINTTELLCSHKYVLRDTIDTYHLLNPTKRVKTVDIIEPRGVDGCYYRWKTVDYTAATNTEGNVITQSEIVRQYKINDTSTCVWSPTNTFTTDMTNYPIRQYIDPSTKVVMYPTRKVTSTATVKARYVRIRPSNLRINTDGFLAISQIAVYDSTGNNLALNKRVYATSTYANQDGTSGNFAPPNTIVDGTISSRESTSVWQPATGNTATEYIEIDLGQMCLIDNIIYCGRLDYGEWRNNGVRIQLLNTNGPTDTPIVEKVTLTSETVQSFDLTTKTITPKFPAKPFQVPRSLPAEAKLGGCPARCQDTPQIDSFVKQFNDANPNTQILKVLKAITPSDTRCDYEVEMLDAKASKKTVSKEYVSVTATKNNTAISTAIYGRYVRIVPPATDFIKVSQVLVNNNTGVNVAVNKKVYATSNNNIASCITNGLNNDFWTNVSKTSEYIEIDFGRVQDIASIVIAAPPDEKVYPNTMVHILVTNEVNAIPIFSASIPPTRIITCTNTCAFNFTNPSYTSNFIQDNTPALSSPDTSGGVLTFQSIGKTVTDIFSKVTKSLKDLDPLKILETKVSEVHDEATKILDATVLNTSLIGCPTTKCSNPAVLLAIIDKYNSSSTVDIGVETNTMTRVLKAAVSGPTTCDILFSNTRSIYEDYLYPPGSSETSTLLKRFRMVRKGDCNMWDVESIIDLSMNTSINKSSPINKAEVITSPTPTVPQVNCRDPAILRLLKTRLDTQSKSETNLPSFKSIMQSFATNSSTCEYFMTKDITKVDTKLKTDSTETGFDTYVTATFTRDAAGAFTLNTVTEYDPELIEPDAAGNYTINGTRVTLPYLYAYDNTTPSPRVDATVQNI